MINIQGQINIDTWKRYIFEQVYGYYDEPHRFYHTREHIEDLFTQIDKVDNLSRNEKCILYLAAIYHDVIYDPRSKTNEEDSAELFKLHYGKSDSIRDEVIEIIFDTKTHQASTKLSAIFSSMDMDILRRPIAELIEYENKIFKEFQFVDYNVYITRRVEFLTNIQDELDVDLEALIAYVQHRKPNIAVYPGSFNPFHKGHLNILQKAERIFDKVIIAIGTNPDKKHIQNESVMLNGDKSKLIPNLPTELNFRQQEVYEGMLTEFVDSLGYPVTVIRGLRNSTDLQYELNQYRFLQDLTDNKINIVSIFCDSEYEHISSSAIRQLTHYKKADRYTL